MPNPPKKDLPEGASLLIVALICSILSYSGILSFVLAFVAAFAASQGVLKLMESKGRKSLYDRYKYFINAACCLIFGSSFGLLTLAAVFFLIKGVLDLAHGKQGLPDLPKHQKPPLPKREPVKGAYMNHETHSAANTSDNPYAAFNNDKIVKQAQSYMNGTLKSVQTPKGYQTALKHLKADITELDQRQKSVASFLDDFFEGSAISKTRYLETLKNARAGLQTNYDKASQAVKLFGNSEPTKERMDILNRYVEDSDEILNKVEKVINELILVQQNDVIHSGETLDSLLDDLAKTTAYYQKSPSSSGFSSSADTSEKTQNGV